MPKTKALAERNIPNLHVRFEDALRIWTRRTFRSQFDFNNAVHATLFHGGQSVLVADRQFKNGEIFLYEVQAECRAKGHKRPCLFWVAPWELEEVNG